jgi:hypothetical protein
MVSFMVSKIINLTLTPKGFYAKFYFDWASLTIILSFRMHRQKNIDPVIIS